MLVEPRTNHSSSRTTASNKTFFVVNKGNPFRKSYWVCRPNSDNVPVPVRSVFFVPFSSTWRTSSRYSCTIAPLKKASHTLLLHRSIRVVRHPMYSIAWPCSITDRKCKRYCATAPSGVHPRRSPRCDKRTRWRQLHRKG